MRKNLTERQRLSKVIIGAIREAIRIHGPITKLKIGSVAKRIVGTLLARRKTKE